MDVAHYCYICYTRLYEIDSAWYCPDHGMVLNLKVFNGSKEKEADKALDG
jgi:hypothetical protein